MRSRQSNLLVNIVLNCGKFILKSTEKICSWTLPGGIIYDFHKVDVEDLERKVRFECHNQDKIDGLKDKLFNLNNSKYVVGFYAEVVRDLGLTTIFMGVSGIYELGMYLVLNQKKQYDGDLLTELMPLLSGYAVGTLIGMLWKRSFIQSVKSELKEIFGGEQEATHSEPAYASANDDSDDDKESWYKFARENEEDIKRESSSRNRVGKYFNSLPKEFDWKSFDEQFKKWLE